MNKSRSPLHCEQTPIRLSPNTPQDVTGGIKEVVGLLVLEVAALVVLGFKVVAFFRTHAGTLGEGDILGAGLSAVVFATDIGGAQRVRSGVYHGLSDGPFKMMHDAAEVGRGGRIGGEAG